MCFDSCGKSSISIVSQPEKLVSSNGKISPLSSAASTRLYLFFITQKFRCLQFFIIGLLIGVFPLSHLDQDFRNQEFGVEIKPTRVDPAFDDHKVKHCNCDSSINIQHPERVLSSKVDSEPRKQLIIVTSTYNRMLQAYFLNKLAQVLMLVHPPLLWIVVDINTLSMETEEILRKTGLMYRHLACVANLTDTEDADLRACQHNVALEHIEKHRIDGIVHFADDDIVYAVELFESLRKISRFGTWPVALLFPGKNTVLVDAPVCNGSKVIGWHTDEKTKHLHRFHADMFGFAFNSSIVWDPQIWGHPFLDPIRQFGSPKKDSQAPAFIEQIVEDESQMEGVPDGCLKILAWNLHLQSHDLPYPQSWLLQRNLDVILPHW